LNKFPDTTKDRRLSTTVINSEIYMGLQYDMYDRINEGAVTEAFIKLCKAHYQGKDIIVSNKVLDDDLLKSAGFTSVKYVNTPVLSPKYSEFILKQSFKSIWYNPIIFSDIGYKKINRYPLITNPVFQSSYPYEIIFIKGTSTDSTVISVICGRYLILAPNEFYQKWIKDKESDL